MTRDEIIAMARDAGLLHDWMAPGESSIDALQRFAELVAAAERDRVLYAATEGARLAVEAEREACANIALQRMLLYASNSVRRGYELACKNIAEAIRARSTQ